MKNKPDPTSPPTLKLVDETDEPVPQKSHKFTGFEEKFCHEYVVNGRRGARAARAAGYSKKGSSDTAFKLLGKPHIATRIEEITEVELEEIGVNKFVLLRELADISYSDLRDALDENGHLLPIEDWPDSIAAAVSSVKVTSYKPKGKDEPIEYTKEIKFWDKRGALSELAKVMGLTKDDDSKAPVTIIVSSADVAGL